MKYYIISGEASGDLHGANLIKELKKIDSDATFRCWGGDRMLEVGVDLVKHYKEISFMGFVEVIKNIDIIFKNRNFCRKDIRKYSPDCVILIDFPGFNLEIAKYAKKLGIKVIYFISPQVWAWHKSRVKAIKKYVDKMLVILPFEKDFYSQYNYDVEYVGHPLVDILNEARNKYQGKRVFINKYNLGDKKIIALLPGSREQEIKKILPIITSITNEYEEYQFIIAGVKHFDRAFYEKYSFNKNIDIIYDDTYNLLFSAEAAIVTSGTATLETALAKVPQIVCYKGNRLSYLIAKKLVNVKYISLVNLIMDKLVVKELIQMDLTVNNIKEELDKIINDRNYRDNMINNYEMLIRKINSDNAAKKAAMIINNFIYQNKM